MTPWDAENKIGMSSDDMRDAVDIHLSRHIGHYETAFTDEDGWAGESGEDGPPVDVLVVPPDGERKFAYVASFGCAFEPLPSEVYSREGMKRRVEFVLAAQQYEDEEESRRSLNLAANTVRQFAKLVHMNGVTVEPGETVAFSDEPQPIFKGVDFCAFAFIAPRLPGPGFNQMKIADSQLGEPVHYIAPVPIHKSELDLSLEHGPAALLDVLHRAGVTEMVDMARKPVVSGQSGEVVVAETQVQPRSLVGKFLAMIGIR